MKTTKVKSLGVEFPLEVPSKEEEFDNMAGEDGACVDAANLLVIRHKLLNKFREAFALEVERSTGIPIERKKRLNSKKKPILDDKGAVVMDFAETEETYISRVKAMKPEFDFQPCVQSVLTLKDPEDNTKPLIRFDPRRTERSAAEPEPSKRVLEHAKSILAMRSTDEEKFNRAMFALKEFMKEPLSLSNTETDVKLVARAYQAWLAAQPITLLTD